MAISMERQHGENDTHTVAIALGSNLGDSFRNIEYALRLLELPTEILNSEVISLVQDPFVNVVNTSFLYETEPMYVTDQPKFINCACMIETNLAPMLLLRLLKQIEMTVGRVPSILNGPRAVDLDIIFYDDEVIDTRSLIARDPEYNDVEGELIIPHPRVQEREFALRPLNDMIPSYIHPKLKKTISSLFKEICEHPRSPMNKVIPFPRLPVSVPLVPPLPSTSTISETLTHWTYPSNLYASPPSSFREFLSSSTTHIMATLNVTPDSFSDGSLHSSPSAALSYSLSSVKSGASIIDIGGYSTRPGAAFVSVEDEIERVVPVVETLRDYHNLREALAPQEDDELVKKVTDTLISIDTFRWEVAEAALHAGANCINDVYAFTGPDSWPLPSSYAIHSEEYRRVEETMTKMKEIARKYAAPVILMHSRGDAGKNKDYSSYDYVLTTPAGPGDQSENDGAATLEAVRIELGAKVDRIVLGKGGLRRWLVIIDPGIGFSKSLEGNLEVLRNSRKVVEDVVVGDPKRKTYSNPLSEFPLLIGASRKSFLGAILSQSPNGRETKPAERNWATAAAVACAVQQGAVVVRVHDVQEMSDVVRVAGALWTRG